MELATDKNGNIKSWKIVYCGWETPKKLFDENEPFKTAYVSAHTAEDAVKSLKEPSGKPTFRPYLPQNWKAHRMNQNNHDVLLIAPPKTL